MDREILWVLEVDAGAPEATMLDEPKLDELTLDEPELDGGTPEDAMLSINLCSCGATKKLEEDDGKLEVDDGKLEVDDGKLTKRQTLSAFAGRLRFMITTGAAWLLDMAPAWPLAVAPAWPPDAAPAWPLDAAPAWPLDAAPAWLLDAAPAWPLDTAPALELWLVVLINPRGSEDLNFLAPDDVEASDDDPLRVAEVDDDEDIAPA